VQCGHVEMKMRAEELPCKRVLLSGSARKTESACCRDPQGRACGSDSHDEAHQRLDGRWYAHSGVTAVQVMMSLVGKRVELDTVALKDKPDLERQVPTVSHSCHWDSESTGNR
jgi:hypothetical protein